MSSFTVLPYPYFFYQFSRFCAAGSPSPINVLFSALSARHTVAGERQMIVWCWTFQSGLLNLRQHQKNLIILSFCGSKQNPKCRSGSQWFHISDCIQKKFLTCVWQFSVQHFLFSHPLSMAYELSEIKLFIHEDSDFILRILLRGV